MSRYIDKDKLLERMDDISAYYEEDREVKDEMIALVYDFLTANVEEVRHGEWLPTGICHACSECDFYVYNTAFEEPAFYHQGYHYCPNCGAKMDGGEEQ